MIGFFARLLRRVLAYSRGLLGRIPGRQLLTSTGSGERKLNRLLSSRSGRLANAASRIATRRCPVRSGRLRGTISIRKDTNGHLVITNTNYAGFVETGTRFQRAQPYMGPAKNTVEAEINGSVVGVTFTFQGFVIVGYSLLRGPIWRFVTERQRIQVFLGTFFDLEHHVNGTFNEISIKYDPYRGRLRKLWRIPHGPLIN